MAKTVKVVPEDPKLIARTLCDEGDHMRYVLTALATAVQEQVGEDIILCPREEREVSLQAIVLSVKFKNRDQQLWRHYIHYGAGTEESPSPEDVLRTTLDVAHELGHLVIDRGPGQMTSRVGVRDDELEGVREAEADWFALCILQMYGFLFGP